MAVENKTFHLGICMAGAITAGSYTAGVMDYILESLERWQQQKDANKDAFENGVDVPFPETPMYDVVIDVISGASAGGMCAAITSAMLVEGFTIDDLSNKKSKMYKSWIELDDDGIEEGTIKKMLESDDIKKDGLVSILNSDVLTNISKKAVKYISEKKLPKYVDKELDVIMTLANLRGTKYGIEFKSYGTTKMHLMTLHRDFMHFKLSKKALSDSDFLEMDFSKNEHLQLFQESAVATGAFPIGLRARALVRSAKYYYNQANVTAGIADLYEGKLIPLVPNPNENNYHSLNIDGGTFNNEPFGETERVINEKSGKQKGGDLGYNKTNRTILMIDPFPSNERESDEDNLKSTIIDVAPRIIGALREQSSFKTKDLLDALGEDNYLKYLITPVKDNSSDPLCCSTLGAFGGFIYRDFREHDYILGRRNAQQFLRKHFVLKFSEIESENNPIHQGWTKEAIKKFKTSESDLPIIPDVQKDIEASIVLSPKYPKYPLKKLKELEEPLNNRIIAILDSFESMSEQKSEKEELEVVKDWFKKSRMQRFFSSIGSFIGKPIIWIVVRKIKKELRVTLVEGIIKWILKDLKKADLLEE